MTKEKKYYLIVYIFTPYYCDPIYGMAVLSEHPLDVIERTNKLHRQERDIFSITQFEKITKGFYDQKKYMNPTKEHFVRLSDDDFAERA